MKKYNQKYEENEESFEQEQSQLNLHKLPKEISSVVLQDVFVPNKNVNVVPVAPIDVFFKNKEEQLQKKQYNFSKILQSQQFQQINNDHNFNKSISKFSRFSKSSANKKDEKQSQLKGVIQEHKKMLTKLQTKIKSEEQLNQFQKNLLKQEKSRYLSKIQQLQAEIQELYRDNYRLKELQKMQKLKSTQSFQAGNFDEKSREEINKPYVINTRNNDLNIINNKNYEKSKEKFKEKDKEKQDILGNKLQKERPITAQQFFNKKPIYFGLYQQKFPSIKSVKVQQNFILKDLLESSFDDKHKPPIQKSIIPNINQSSQYKSIQNQNSRNISMDSINRGQHFDTFRMANSLSYVNDSAINQSRQMVNMSSTTSTRNKVAFFKNSLVIVREPEIQIAFKRSQMNESLNKMRIIFYLNNKTNSKKTINFTYEYQHEYFQIDIIEKLNYVGSQAQGRQVIEVSLISTIDLNGVTDAHVQVDSKIYDFWLPANFINFKKIEHYRMQHDQLQMNILPDKQFSTFARMSEVVALMYGGKDKEQQWAYLYGQSRFGNMTMKLSWRGKQLIIECSDKWIQFIGFILHFFK